VVDVRVSSTELRIDEAAREMVDLHAHWSGRRPGILPPTWGDFDVVELRPWLGRLCLYERSGDDDFHCRVRGSLLTNHAGLVRDRHPIGAAPYAPLAVQHFRRVLEEARPTRHVVELELDGFQYAFDRLALPLAPEPRQAPRVLTLVNCDRRRAEEFWRRYQAGAGS
jgi:hypothetical protein